MSNPQSPELKNPYYYRMRNDPEFKRKRKEYNAKRHREAALANTYKRSTWARDNPERAREIDKACRARSQVKYILRNVRKRAKKSGREFNLELSDIVVPDVCPIFGVPFVYGATIDDCDFAPSIDRIDSSKGYVKGNIQVMSRLANCMKWTSTPEQLITFARGVLSLYGVAHEAG